MNWFAGQRKRPMAGRSGTDAPVVPDSPASIDGLTPPERLDHILSDCVGGNLAGAELELHLWRLDPACPGEARWLGSTLAARRGDWQEARRLAQEALDRGDVNPELRIMLITALVELNLEDAAARVLAELFQEDGHRADVAAWLDATGMPGSDRICGLPPALVGQLALDLVGQPEVIPSLVAAQQIHPDMEAVALLRAALAHAAADLDQSGHTDILCRAMAELASMADDEDEARRWAHRGLAHNPYSAPLAMVLSRVRDDAAVGPPAVHVLARVSHAHPAWPDVRAAWIRREHRDGRIHVASHQLQAWLAEKPDHPVVRRLVQELAA